MAIIGSKSGSLTKEEFKLYIKQDISGKMNFCFEEMTRRTKDMLFSMSGEAYGVDEQTVYDAFGKDAGELVAFVKSHCELIEKANPGTLDLSKWKEVEVDKEGNAKVAGQADAIVSAQETADVAKV